MVSKRRNTKKELNLSVATPVDPVRIATLRPLSSSLEFSYFYNGKVIYSFCHQFPWPCASFPEIDPTTLQATSWGIRDHQYAVIGQNLINVPPRRCKRIGKHAHYYFIVDGTVFMPSAKGAELDLIAMQNMDARTLKVLGETFAEDVNAVYRKGGLRIDKHELGGPDFEIFEFTGPQILKGTNKIWLSDIGFVDDVDAPSFNVGKRVFDYSELDVLEAEDIHGSLQIFNSKVVKGQFVRRPGENETEFKAFLEKNASEATVPNTWFPEVPVGSVFEQFSALKHWFTTDFSLKWERHIGNLRFHKLVIFFLQLCCELCNKEKGNKTTSDEADSALKVFAHFADYVWLSPEVLHPAACLYAASGRQKEVMACCEQALGYRYANVADMLDDPLIESRLPSSSLEGLKVRAGALQRHLGYISLELMEAYEKAADQAKDNGALAHTFERHILYEWQYYNAEELQQLTTQNNPEQEYWRQLDVKIRWYFKHKMLLNLNFQAPPEVRKKVDSCFVFYRHHDFFNPVALISMADSLFKDMHHWANWQETFFSEEEKRLPPSRKMLQAWELVEAFEASIKPLPQSQQQEYRLKAASYFAFNMLN